MTLGVRGQAAKGRIFVIPEDFVRDLPFNQDYEDGELFKNDLVMDWLVAKGLMTGEANQLLPDFAFDPALGYGWQNIWCEVPTYVYLEVRPKPDGTPGLWMTFQGGEDCRYPRVPGLDMLAVQATLPTKWLTFYGQIVHDCLYEFLEWPTLRPEFMVDGKIPEGGASGLIDIDVDSDVYNSIEGWLDDADNLELQDMLLRNAQDVRFCPSIAVDQSLPASCQPGTVAAAFIANAGCERDARIGVYLLDKARRIATAGLGFYDALMKLNRDRIDTMFDE